MFGGWRPGDDGAGPTDQQQLDELESQQGASNRAATGPSGDYMGNRNANVTAGMLNNDSMASSIGTIKQRIASKNGGNGIGNAASNWNNA